MLVLATSPGFVVTSKSSLAESNTSAGCYVIPLTEDCDCTVFTVTHLINHRKNKVDLI